ncbi:hypothetical protein NM688_g9069 [Phlebia brevispora]|uniref:Uncharacterized protein n=1 Tax=Phlebia brevispora TaxID=194682 RepID=A0ACC1RP39_9APHY|nr:hypothetical protein NM688_g9069 [Phlebia brevispora]
MKGFHDMLPRSGPWCCSWITDLVLTNVHFKSFPYLMRAIGDMPDLTGARLEKVTWDCPSDDEVRPPLARRARFRMDPQYIMQGCTDDAAIVWFRFLLQCPGSKRLAHADADRLYRIVSALSKHSEYKWLGCPEVELESIDVGVLFTFCDEDDYLLFLVHMTFTPAVEGHAVDIMMLFGKRSTTSQDTFLHSKHSTSSPGQGVSIARKISFRYAIEVEIGPPEKWVWTQVDLSSGDEGPKCKLIGPRAAGEFGWVKFL